MSIQPLVVSLSLVFAVPLKAQIADLSLSSNKVVSIPVSTERITTISFPSAPSAIHAAYVSTNAEPDAKFVMFYTAGASFFSLQALGTNVTASMNVVWQRVPYALELTSSEKPLLVVRFQEPKNDTMTNNPSPEAPRVAPVPVVTAEPVARPVSKVVNEKSPTNETSPEEFDRAIRDAKANFMSRSPRPVLFGATSVILNRYFSLPSHRLQLCYVHRFQWLEVMVFAVRVSPNEESLKNFVPNRVRVRVGRKVYSPGFIDTSAVKRGLMFVAVSFRDEASTPPLESEFSLFLAP